MAKALLLPPAGLPVTLAQAKAHMRIETDAEDAYLLDLLAAAVGTVEAETCKVMLTQTWRFYLDEIPACGLLELSFGPVRSVGPVTVYDGSGVPAVLPPADYQVDRHGDPARIFFRRRQPTGRAINGVEVDVVAGYGDSGADVPDQLARAVLVLIAHWHAFRGSASDAALMGSFPKGFDALIAPFRRVRL